MINSNNKAQHANLHYVIYDAQISKYPKILFFDKVDTTWLIIPNPGQMKTKISGRPKHLKETKPMLDQSYQPGQKSSVELTIS